MTAEPGGGRFPRITEEGLDALRRRIGVRIQDSLEPWCHEATRDNIRHYAHGIGDDNPSGSTRPMRVPPGTET